MASPAPLVPWRGRWALQWSCHARAGGVLLGLCAPKAALGVQGELPKPTRSEERNWAAHCLFRHRRIKYSREEPGSKANQSCGFGAGTPHHGVPLGIPGALPGDSHRLLPSPSIICSQPQLRQELGCSHWGNNLGCSCWGCKTSQIGHYHPKAQGPHPLPAQPALPKASRAPSRQTPPAAQPGGQHGFESFILSIPLIFDGVVCLKGDCNHFKFILRL